MGAIARRCLPYEGCQGQGWRWDPWDSGSGAWVYCSCSAGDEQHAADKATLASPAGLPAPAAGTKEEG